MKPTKNNKLRRGTTVVEGVVALTLFSLAVGMGGMVVNSTSAAYSQVHANTSAGTQIRFQADRIADELASISTENIFPVPSTDWGSNFLNFRKIEDIKDGVPVWGTRSVIFLTYEEGEEDDGKDNNGDGIADECRVMLARNAGGADQTLVTLMRGVSEYAIDESPNGNDDNGNGVIDEHGLSFHLEGNVLTVRLTSVELDSHNDLIQRSSERSFRLMN